MDIETEFIEKGYVVVEGVLTEEEIRDARDALYAPSDGSTAS